MKKLFFITFSLTPVFFVGASTAHAATISSRYPGDVGISSDPDVLFAESFDSGTVTDISNRFTTRVNTAGMSLTTDVPAGNSGGRSLTMTAIGGQNKGGYLFKRLAQPQDRVYFRYYVKYAPTGSYHHAGGKFGGYNPPTDWPQGGAGLRPSGSDRFTNNIEIYPSDRADFYTYWKDMRPDGNGDYWGHSFINNPAVKFTRNQWICVEGMVKLNTPATSANGELALSLNGQEVFRRGNFQWRTTTALQTNFIQLEYYTTKDPAGFRGKMQFDQVVVAKSPIGCMVPGL